MSILKIVSEPYLNHDALEKEIHGYVFRKALLIGGLSVDPLHAAEQMHLVKRLWFQTEGCQLRHFILSFDNGECEHINGTWSLQAGAYGICEYYADQYQIVFGIHRNREGRWHIHFVMNTVSFLTGKKYQVKNVYDYDLSHHILTCLLPTDGVRVYYE